jgi:hypothetical protein
VFELSVWQQNEPFIVYVGHVFFSCLIFGPVSGNYVLKLRNQEAALVSRGKLGMDGNPFPFALQRVCARGVPMRN